MEIIQKSGAHAVITDMMSEYIDFFEFAAFSALQLHVAMETQAI